MKQLFKLFTLIITIMVAVSSSIYADEQNNPNNYNNEYIYIDSEGYEHRFFDAHGNPIKIDDLEDYSSKTSINYSQPRRGPVGPPDTISIVSTNRINGTRKKVTADFRGPCQISYAESYTSNATFTGGISASIQSRIFTKVKIEVEASISWSSSSQTGFSVSYNVPSGKIGALYFTPYLSRSNVNYYDINGNLINVTATFPITTSGGFTDGLYELVTRNG